eukprot:scaffold9640_cov63-Phaeocystis_antarctica.AAC.5
MEPLAVGSLGTWMPRDGAGHGARGTGRGARLCVLAAVVTRARHLGVLAVADELVGVRKLGLARAQLLELRLEAVGVVALAASAARLVQLGRHAVVVRQQQLRARDLVGSKE